MIEIEVYVAGSNGRSVEACGYRGIELSSFGVIEVSKSETTELSRFGISTAAMGGARGFGGV